MERRHLRYTKECEVNPSIGWKSERADITWKMNRNIQKMEEYSCNRNLLSTVPGIKIVKIDNRGFYMF